MPHFAQRQEFQRLWPQHNAWCRWRYLSRQDPQPRRSLEGTARWMRRIMVSLAIPREHLRLQTLAQCDFRWRPPAHACRHRLEWYYFRDHDFKSLRELWHIGNKIADAAAMPPKRPSPAKSWHRAPPFRQQAACGFAHAMSNGSSCQWSATTKPRAGGAVTKASSFSRFRDKDFALKAWPPRRSDAHGRGSDDIVISFWTVPHHVALSFHIQTPSR